MAWRSMMPNQTSTRLSHEAKVGGEADVEARVLLQPVAALGRLVGGVVVHHEMHSCSPPAGQNTWFAHATVSHVTISAMTIQLSSDALALNVDRGDTRSAPAWRIAP